MLTQALREEDQARLEADLVSVLKEGEAEWVKDDRDLIMALAPRHDCASRLGMDVASLFRRAAASASPSLRATVEAFGERTDIAPDRWEFEVVNTLNGPEYRRTGPSGQEIVEDLRRAGSPDHEA